MSQCEMPLLFMIAGLWTLLAMLTVVPVSAALVTGRSGRWGKVGAALLLDAVVLMAYAVIGSLPPLLLVLWGVVVVIASFSLSAAVLFGVRKASVRDSVLVALGLVLVTAAAGYGAAVMQLGGEVSGRDSFCQAKLMEIHHALNMYRDENGGRMPPRAHWRRALTPYMGQVAGELTATYGPKTYFVCRYSADKTYRYTGEPLSSKDDKPIVYCRHRPIFNAGYRIVVLYADGQVRVIPGKSLPGKQPERH